MVCGRLRVRLVKVRGHSDVVERNVEVKESQFISSILSVKLIQLIGWPLQGLPQPSAIVSLVYRLTNTLMSLLSKQTVIMCRLEVNNAKQTHKVCSLSVYVCLSVCLSIFFLSPMQ